MNDSDIAIIGLACRFPKASTPEAFWKNLQEGIESVTCFSDAELRAEGVPDDLIGHPDYVKKSAVLDSVGDFDAPFFNYAPAEAARLDPQHRLFLECAVEALEDAGIAPSRSTFPIGLYAGVGDNGYQRNHLTNNPSLIKSVGEYQILLDSDSGFLCTRTAYKLNLQGPSLTVQTACSTSLVSVHLAAQGLLSGDCDVALAGGVSIQFPDRVGYLYQEGMILSPDGHCRAFSNEAKGTTIGSGAGIVVLKRLADALDEHDSIHAVIKGSAINNDGATKVNFSAPSIEGQSAVIREALEVAQVSPDSIDYVETHGTGTVLGDPIEIAGLKQAFQTDDRHVCALGSVKTNIGHTDAAAGVAGLIKTVLALKHGKIPPSLNFREINPKINFDNSPFYVNTELRSWPNTATPRRAGVSSFGIGGTNAHVVLEEPPARQEPRQEQPIQLVVLSARTSSALEQTTENLERFLKSQNAINLADLAFTFAVGRKRYAHRKFFVCENINGLQQSLANTSAGIPVRSNTEERDVAFLFPGQGSQSIRTTQTLYETEPVFRRNLDLCDSHLASKLDVSLLDLIYPAPDKESEAKEQLDRTEYTQPALFAINYSLAQLWMSWGLRPSAFIGHSLGEYVAATLAGVFQLEDAIRLVASRGQLMQALPSGTMLAVASTETGICDQLNAANLGGCSVAAVNSAGSCVVSGPTGEIERLEVALEEAGTANRRLRTSHAFHSPMMDPILTSFTEEVSAVPREQPTLPYISNVTGTWIRPEEATDPKYWTKHMRTTVRFSDGIACLLKESDAILLECGPGQTLTRLAKEQPQKPSPDLVPSLPTSTSDKSEHEALYEALGRLWQAGTFIDWKKFYTKQAPYRISLPTYPFERKRYWIERPSKADQLNAIPPIPPTGKQPFTDWFYVPSWRRSLAITQVPQPTHRRFIILSKSQSSGPLLVNQLQQNNQEVRHIRISDSPDFNTLVAGLLIQNDSESTYVYLSSPEPDSEPNANAASEACFHLASLANALGISTVPVSLYLVTQQAFNVTGNETPCPTEMGLVAAAKTIAQELPHLRCRVRDIESVTNESAFHPLVAELLAKESTPASPIAFRGRYQWEPTYQAIPSDAFGQKTSGDELICHGAAYLITGGLGRIGLSYAEHIAARRPKLVLLSRSLFPAAQYWEQWLDEHSDGDPIARKIRRLQAIEKQGADILIRRANVSRLDELATAIDEAEQRFGRLRGIIHAAGETATAFRSLGSVTIGQCQDQFAPKAHGLINLETAVEGRTLDFCIVLSSLSSVLGGIGFAAYAAANAFMDAFVQRHNQCHPRQPWLSVNWDGWDFPNSKPAHTKLPKSLGSSLDEYALTPNEGHKALDSLLGITPFEQVIVSTGNLNTRLELWTNTQPDASPAADELSTLNNTTHDRPALSTEYEAPSTALESDLCALWEELLGIDRIGVNDEFWELGGHSLLGTQLIARIRQRWQRSLPLQTLFDFPTVCGLAAQLPNPPGPDAIPDIEAGRAQPEPLPPFKKRSKESGSPIPLSFAQQRLWFLCQMDGAEGIYNIPMQFRIKGPVNVNALESALRKVEERHESLRTTFSDHQGQVVQRVHGARVQLEQIDLSLPPSDEQEAALDTFARESANQSFDLRQGPLWIARLAKLADEDHILFVTFHHIVFDGWSSGILLDELGSAYSTPNQSLPPIAAQYTDFSAWHQDWLQGAVLEKHLEFWKKQLRNAPTLLNLPTDYPRPPAQSDRGDEILFSLSAELTLSLKELSQTHGATLFMTLQAAFVTLLARYSGQADICIGTPIANRPIAEIERTIGLFLNAIVLRNDLSGDPTFSEFLDRTRQTALAAYEHQSLPFETLVEAIRPERTVAHSPIFQVMFNLLNTHDVGFDLKGLEVEAVDAPYHVAKHDLILTMKESADQVYGAFEFRKDLFQKETIQRWAQHFETLLRGIVTSPKTPLSQLPILPSDERTWLLDAGQGPLRNVSEKCYHQLFEDQVQKSPDSLAVIANDSQTGKSIRLTYHELNRQANQLAHHLQSLDRGTANETVVGVCLERSSWTLVTLIALFKSGNAYLPLDAGLPRERLSQMINQSAADFVITTSDLRDRLGESMENIVELDTLAWDNHPDINLAGNETSRRLAYILFTSGSTGLPKAVMIEHLGMINNLFAKIEAHGLSAADKMAQTAVPSFDISIWQFLAAPLVGGTVLIFPDDVAKDPHALLAQVIKEQITVLEVVPSLFRCMVDELAQEADQLPLETLRWLSLTGEALPPKLCNDWFSLYPNIPILNAYGPAECSDDATHYRISAPLPIDATTVPIGNAIPNVRLYVLDSQRQFLPLGIPGELYVGGIGVGRGYYRDSIRTEERFLPDPYSPTLNARMYRTGDAARFHHDGNLEFLGRLDYQVKIRGFRIELGEIESRLQDHPTVAEAVASVVPGLEGESQLVAYTTLSPQGKAEAKQLREQTQQVALWESLHEQSYLAELLLNDDPTLNVIGWDSSYSNTPLPPEEMYEYIDHAVDLVLSHRPQRLLEIGCGTGLLAFRLIPHLETYHGCDLSNVAIEQLRNRQRDPTLCAQIKGLGQATFETRAADDLGSFEANIFDAVILPSVVQYFPNGKYLESVIRELVRIVRPGGIIIVSDVRHRSLLPAFHASLQHHSAPPDLTVAELRQRWLKQGLQEQELAIDPEFFLRMTESTTALSHVETRPKRGHILNEMTRFRYDAVLHVDGLAPEKPDIIWQDAAQTPITLEGIEARLANESTLGIRKLTNVRTATAIALAEYLQHGNDTNTLADFESQKATLPGLEPEGLIALGKKTGHRVHLSVADSILKGTYDVLFERDLALPPAMPRPDLSKSLDQLDTNNPLRENLNQALLSVWRTYLQARLPHYMVPAQIILLDSLPLTPNGKLDRQRLPIPEARRRNESDQIAPRTDTERQLAKIWRDVLNLAELGIHDDFFELGGHSLLATQVIARIRRDLTIELPLRELFTSPTIAELAINLEAFLLSQEIQTDEVTNATEREDLVI